MKKKNKLNAKKAEVDGYKFDSMKEAQQYLFLKGELHAGRIRDLRVHPRYTLEVNGTKVCGFHPDFEFFDVAKGAVRVQDVKGMKFGVPFQLFRVKAKLLHALKGIEVEVV